MKRIVLKIYYDKWPEDPRKNSDCILGTIICFDRKYRIGDCHGYSTPKEFLYELAQSANPGFFDMMLNLNEDFSIEDDIEILFKLIEDEVVILPLRVVADEYNPSISVDYHFDFDDIYDKESVGFIYAYHDEIRKIHGEITPDVLDKAKKTLIAEVDVYNKYISGETYSYRLVVMENGHEVEELDSCSGFYGMDRLRDFVEDVHSNLTIDDEEFCGDGSYDM